MLPELKTFLAIARYGTFSAAGERIGLTQSAVSAQVKRLEDDLRIALFERYGRSARLNDAGRALVDMAEQLLGSYEEIREQLHGKLPVGTIRIGAIPTAQIGLLPNALVEFRHRFPNVDIKIKPGTSAQLLDQLDADELDMAIVIRPPFDLPRQLHWEALLHEPYVLIAPAGIRAKTPMQIFEEHPFIRYDRLSFGGRPVQRFLASQRISVKDFVELKELEAIVRMVELGLGVSIIPHAGTLQLQDRSVRLIPLANPFHREIGIVGSDAGKRRPSIETMASCLQRVAKKAFSRKKGKS